MSFFVHLRRAPSSCACSVNNCTKLCVYPRYTTERSSRFPTGVSSLTVGLLAVAIINLPAHREPMLISKSFIKRHKRSVSLMRSLSPEIVTQIRIRKECHGHTRAFQNLDRPFVPRPPINYCRSDCIFQLNQRNGTEEPLDRMLRTRWIVKYFTKIHVFATTRRDLFVGVTSRSIPSSRNHEFQRVNSTRRLKTEI